MEGKTQENEIALENQEAAILWLSGMPCLFTVLFLNLVRIFCVQIYLSFCSSQWGLYKAGVARMLLSSQLYFNFSFYVNFYLQSPKLTGYTLSWWPTPSLEKTAWLTQFQSANSMVQSPVAKKPRPYFMQFTILLTILPSPWSSHTGQTLSTCSELSHMLESLYPYSSSFYSWCS